MLVRVRDEIKMTIQAYQTLYESSIAFGMRKALMAELEKNTVSQDIAELETRCRDADQDIRANQEEIETLIREDAEKTEEELQQHRDQVAHLNDLNADYKQELETMLATPVK